jgi:uroporphyrinogen decarboxylase
MVQDMMVEPYRRLTGFIKDHGVDLIFLDSDGMVDPLIPIWIESGVTGFYPLERAAGMDPVAVRARHGPGLRLMGGIDKRAMALGGAALEAEVARVAPLLREGGYVAWCDHYVPPGVSLANYQHYVRLVREAGQG